MFVQSVCVGDLLLFTVVPPSIHPSYNHLPDTGLQEFAAFVVLKKML